MLRLYFVLSNSEGGILLSRSYCPAQKNKKEEKAPAPAPPLLGDVSGTDFCK